MAPAGRPHPGAGNAARDEMWFSRKKTDQPSRGCPVLMDERDEAGLIDRALAGDHQAFGHLVDAHGRVVYNLALRMVDDPEDARDLSQTVFAKAYQKLARFDRRNRFFSWIYRITINESLNLLSRRRRHEELDEALAADDRGPEARCAAAEENGLVQRGLMELSPDHRMVIISPALLGAVPPRDERRAAGAREDREVAAPYRARPAGRDPAPLGMRAGMSDRDLDILIQDVLDGTASSEQRARLEAELAANPQALGRRRELERVFERLRGVPHEEAPAGLRAEVLNRLRAPGARERAHWLGRARATLATRGTLRIALPFALGFAAGAIAFVGGPGVPGREIEQGAVGTMMPAGDAALRWREGRMTVTLRGERRGDRQILGITAESAGGGGEIELRFDPEHTRLAAFRQEDARQGGVETGPDRLKLLPGAHGEYRLELLQLEGGGPVVVTSRSESGASVRTLAADFGVPEER